MEDLEASDVRELARAVLEDPDLLAAFVLEYRGEGEAADSLAQFAGERRDEAPKVDIVELERLAFSRPDRMNLEKQRAAERDLAVIAAERRGVEDELRRALIATLSPPTDMPTEQRSSRVGALAVAGIVLVGILGFMLAALFAEPSSLSVFDRPQSAEDLEAAESVAHLLGFDDASVEGERMLASVRLLAEDDDIVFVAYTVGSISPLLGDESGVCLLMRAKDGASGGNACGALREVHQTGMSGTSTMPSGRYSYTWGPTGPIEYTLEKKP